MVIAAAAIRSQYFLKKSIGNKITKPPRTNLNFYLFQKAEILFSGQNMAFIKMIFFYYYYFYGFFGIAEFL